MDFDKIAQSLLPLLGGKENIASAAHCATNANHLWHRRG